MISGILQPDINVLFDGISLNGWTVVDYYGHGNVKISDSCVYLDKGLMITGIKWENDFPDMNYEVSLEAKRVDGNDFFCGMTFPVKESYNTLVIGGWGGYVVGLSCIDGEDAANNITYDTRNFELDQWYNIRLRVTDTKIEAWIDADKIIDFTIGDHTLSLRLEVESFTPFGIATWKTTGALRNIKLKKIE